MTTRHSNKYVYLIQTKAAHFQHFSICICPPFEIINNLVMMKIGHLRILSTCSHLLDLFPVKYVEDTASNEQLDLGPGNKYTHSLEGLTREKVEDADRQKWM